ncbi:hypothetical protein K1719_022009 [Acacia pycnantha]|nr:hypothetical protein K1719_022009 [Acacia pycnantha]
MPHLQHPIVSSHSLNHFSSYIISLERVTQRTAQITSATLITPNTPSIDIGLLALIEVTRVTSLTTFTRLIHTHRPRRSNDKFDDELGNWHLWRFIFDDPNYTLKIN